LARLGYNYTLTRIDGMTYVDVSSFGQKTQGKGNSGSLEPSKGSLGKAFATSVKGIKPQRRKSAEI